MADLADIAFEIEREHVARALSLVNPNIPAGEPGTCVDCGEDSVRLVDGQCAPCREPRTPRRW